MPLLPPVMTAILFFNKGTLFSSGAVNVRRQRRYRCEHRRAPYRGFGAVPPLVVPPPVPSVRCDRERSQRCCNPSLLSRRRRPRARDEVSPALGPDGSLCLSLAPQIKFRRISRTAFTVATNRRRQEVRRRSCRSRRTRGRGRPSQFPPTSRSAS